MTKILNFAIVTSLILMFSCSKDKFPTSADLSGNWIEQNNDSFKSRLVFINDGSLIFITLNTIDTMEYTLDKENHLIYLTSNAGHSIHEIFLNKKKQELTVLGLFASFSLDISETIFKKE